MFNIYTKRASSAIRTLNGYIRRKEEDRIQTENIKIARNILTRKGSINTKSMKQIYADYLRKRNLLQKVKLKNQRSASLVPISHIDSPMKMLKESSKVRSNICLNRNILKGINDKAFIYNRLKKLVNVIQNIN